jgi:hypothetical protein
LWAGRGGRWDSHGVPLALIIDPLGPVIVLSGTWWSDGQRWSPARTDLRFPISGFRAARDRCRWDVVVGRRALT